MPYGTGSGAYSGMRTGNTNLGCAAEGRPERFGGPVIQDDMSKEILKQAVRLSMPSDEIGRLAVEGLQRGDFYIVTHPHNRDYIVERYGEILGHVFGAQCALVGWWDWSKNLRDMFE